MRCMSPPFGRFGSRWRAAALATVFIVAVAEPSVGEPAQQEAFPSAEAASQSLYQAVQQQDDQAVIAILGADKELVSVGDDVLEKLEREQFVQKYEEMHRLVRERDGHEVLYIGAENWPFPVPLASQNGTWRFDVDAGRNEVLARRIGDNELTAIEACHALVALERRGRAKPGTDDFTAAVATLLASIESGNTSEPFHGYYFRILESRARSGAAPTGSSRSNHRASRAAAIIAYPAEYRSTGVMTFIVRGDDVVYEKNLGPNTSALAKAMTSYRPDGTWYASTD